MCEALLVRGCEWFFSGHHNKSIVESMKLEFQVIDNDYISWVYQLFKGWFYRFVEQIDLPHIVTSTV